MSKAVNQERFAEIAAEQITETSVDAGVFLDRKEYALVFNDPMGRPLQKIYLHNFYQEYEHSDESALQPILQRILQLAREMRGYGTFAEHAANLMPAMLDRWRAQISNFDLQHRFHQPKGLDFRMGMFVVGEYFAIVPCIDSPQSKMYVHSKMLEAWGVSFNEVFDRAYANLMEKTKESQFETYINKNTGKTSCFGSLWNDHYDASRMLLAEGNQFQGLEVDGDTLVALTSEQLLVFGTEDDFGSAVALSKLEKSQDQPHALPPIPLRLSKDGKWSKWRPPTNHPLYHGFLRAENKYLHGIYTKQAEHLNSVYPQLMNEFFVSSFVPCQHVSGQVSSFCTITEGVPCLLPKTEMITFVRLTDGENGDVIATGRWDRIAEIMGERLEKTNEFPARYKVMTFPSEKELAQIGMQPIF